MPFHLFSKTTLDHPYSATLPALAVAVVLAYPALYLSGTSSISVLQRADPTVEATSIYQLLRAYGDNVFGRVPNAEYWCKDIVNGMVQKAYCATQTFQSASEMARVLLETHAQKTVAVPISFNLSQYHLGRMDYLLLTLLYCAMAAFVCYRFKMYGRCCTAYVIFFMVAMATLSNMAASTVCYLIYGATLPSVVTMVLPLWAQYTYVTLNHEMLPQVLKRGVVYLAVAAGSLSVVYPISSHFSTHTIVSLVFGFLFYVFAGVNFYITYSQHNVSGTLDEDSVDLDMDQPVTKPRSYSLAFFPCYVAALFMRFSRGSSLYIPYLNVNKLESGCYRYELTTLLDGPLTPDTFSFTKHYAVELVTLLILVLASATFLFHVFRPMPVTIERPISKPELTVSDNVSHYLDIVSMSNSQEELVTLGLDRKLHIHKANRTVDLQHRWPVRKLVVDHTTVGVVWKRGVSIWKDGKWAIETEMPFEDRVLAAFFKSPKRTPRRRFAVLGRDPVSGAGANQPTSVPAGGVPLQDFVIITRQEMHTLTAEGQIVTKPSPEAIAACVLRTPRMPDRIFTLSPEAVLMPGNIQMPPGTRTVNPLDSLGFLYLSTEKTCILLDPLRKVNIRTFQFPAGFEKAVVSHPTPGFCRFCGAPSLKYLTVAASQGSDVQVQKWKLDSRQGSRDICMRVERDTREIRCLGMDIAVPHCSEFEAETWCADMGTVFGVRKVPQEEEEVVSSLRNRKSSVSKQQSREYEVILSDARDELHTYTVPKSEQGGLLVSSAGECCGWNGGLCVCFGNMTRIIRF